MTERRYLSATTSSFLAAGAAALVGLSVACSRGQLDRASAAAALDTSLVVQRMGAQMLPSSSPVSARSGDPCAKWLAGAPGKLVASGYVRGEAERATRRVGDWMWGWRDVPVHYCRLVPTERLTAEKAPARRWDLVDYTRLSDNLIPVFGQDKKSWFVPTGPCTGMTVTGMHAASNQSDAAAPTEMLADAVCTVKAGPWQARIPEYFRNDGFRIDVVGRFQKYDDGWRLVEVKVVPDSTQTSLIARADSQARATMLAGLRAMQ